MNPIWKDPFGTSNPLYLLFLGTAILLIGTKKVGSFGLFRFSAAMNGAAMFLYSITLLYLNRWKLPTPVRASWRRSLVLLVAVLFFGFFAVWAGWSIGAEWSKSLEVLGQQ